MCVEDNAVEDSRVCTGAINLNGDKKSSPDLFLCPNMSVAHDGVCPTMSVACVLSLLQECNDTCEFWHRPCQS